MHRTFAAGLLMVACLSTAAVTTTAWAAAEIGRIKSVAGVASVVRGKIVTPATAGQLLQVSDVLRTGAGGRVGITFVDNSRFAVGPNSQVALSAFEFNDTTHAGKSLTTVNRGTLAVVSGQIAHENKDAMRVRTPTSLLAARGTRFVVTVEP
ncbi:MAG TPA: FecR domain-containing protein [Caulobacteraceae bacterium]